MYNMKGVYLSAVANILIWSPGRTMPHRYRVGKHVFLRKTMEICRQIRFDGLYETAIVSLVYLG